MSLSSNDVNFLEEREKEMATHSSILALKDPMKSLVGYSPQGCKEWTGLSDFTFTFLEELKAPWIWQFVSLPLFALFLDVDLLKSLF